MMPLDLILVRHGQSEGNLAKRLSEAGDNSVFQTDFVNRHSSEFRLSHKGRTQARKAGDFLKALFHAIEGPCRKWDSDDAYFVSEYVRAKETAGLLDIPAAQWFCDINLVERDWGEMDIISEEDRKKHFSASLQRREREPFFWRPPGGESFLDLCDRLRSVLDRLHRECSDKRVLIVCHGEVMRAFQVLIERLSQEEFRRLYFSKHSKDRIHNCQVIHYTRRKTVHTKGIAISTHLSSVRSYRPADDSFNSSYWGEVYWREINRVRYSNAELLSQVESVKPMLT